MNTAIHEDLHLEIRFVTAFFTGFNGQRVYLPWWCVI